MKRISRLLCSATVAATLAAPGLAGLFKLDFGHSENIRIPLDPDGNELPAPDPLKDWDIIPTWTFEDPTQFEGKGVANADKTEVTWKLADYSSDATKDSDVTLTIFDNKKLAESINAEAPPYMLGMTANNPGPIGKAAVYDGVLVPAIVKDDYLYRNPDAATSESLMRFANLNPGIYNVTVFEGRTNDNNGRFGKVWVDDITGAKEPATQNTGNYSGVNDQGIPVELGQPRTVTVTLKAGEYLWFAEIEDNSGGISGMIIRTVDKVPEVVDISKSTALIKIDFGQLENERKPILPDGTEGEPPAELKDWNVIPTWTFADPAALGGGGVANPDGTEVTWKLTDFSSVSNKNVSVTMLDNKAIAEAVNAESPPYATGMTANNPTKDAYEAVYDGVVVPAIVKDDYLYRVPDTAGTEMLMRFAGLNPGKYNVTVFEGRTTDGNGRFGKVWVDDIKGAKEPATQNTGNYSGVNIDVGGGTPTPTGQPRTVTVDLAAGQYIWFAEMEDNSGGISGMIIRGLPAASAAVEIVGTSGLGTAFGAVSDATVDTVAKSIKVKTTGTSQFFRVKGSSKIESVTRSGDTVEIKYQ